MLRIAVSGAGGRIGRQIYKTLIDRTDIEIVFGVDKMSVLDLPYPVYKCFSDSPLSCDVVIDFSNPQGTDDLLEYGTTRKIPLVIATTGHTEEQLARIGFASRVIPVFKASNMSLGVNLLSNLAKESAKFLGDSYDVEIVETHHRMKQDAPSGTALSLAEAINEVRDNALVPEFGRHERTKRREAQEIGIHAVRGGTVVGKHDVMFLGSGEVITLSHEAESKEVFVRGALRAAAFLIGKKPDLYDMNSILGSFYAVTTVSVEHNVSIVTLSPIACEEFLELLGAIKRKNINLDMISQSFTPEGKVSVSFTMNDHDLPAVEKIMESQNLPFRSRIGTAKLTAEGAGMEHKAGVAVDVLTTLKGAGADVYAITTSEIKIACCVSEDASSAAEVALRKYYKI
jgi:4-hydroxy-tetrahydrodipicolinate reductase